MTKTTKAKIVVWLLLQPLWYMSFHFIFGKPSEWMWIIGLIFLYGFYRISSEIIIYKDKK